MMFTLRKVYDLNKSVLCSPDNVWQKKVNWCSFSEREREKKDAEHLTADSQWPIRGQLFLSG